MEELIAALTGDELAQVTFRGKYGNEGFVYAKVTPMKTGFEVEFYTPKGAGLKSSETHSATTAPEIVTTILDMKVQHQEFVALTTDE